MEKITINFKSCKVNVGLEVPSLSHCPVVVLRTVTQIGFLDLAVTTAHPMANPGIPEKGLTPKSSRI